MLVTQNLVCDGVAGGVLLRCELYVRCLAPYWSMFMKLGQYWNT